MIQQGEVLHRRAPADAPGGPQGVEVDQGEMRAVVGVEADEEVAGVEVLVDEAGVVEVGRQLGRWRAPATARTFADRRGRHPREPPLDELVERDGLGDRQGDQVVLEEEVPLPLLAQGDRVDRLDADRRGASAARRPSFRPLPRRNHWRAMARTSGTRKCLT